MVAITSSPQWFIKHVQGQVPAGCTNWRLCIQHSPNSLGLGMGSGKAVFAASQALLASTDRIQISYTFICLSPFALCAQLAVLTFSTFTKLLLDLMLGIQDVQIQHCPQRK
jgi:hypothetical protein